MFRALVFIASAYSLLGQPAKDALAVSFPNADWVLLVNSPGYKIVTNENPPNRRYVLASNQKTGVEVSITMEQVPGAAALADCQRTLSDRIKNPGPFKISDPKLSSTKDFITLEYLIHEFQGMPIEQKNVFGCAAKGNAYIDVHFSKAGYTSRDDATFKNLFDVTYIVTNPAANPSTGSSLDYWLKGGERFSKNDFANAVEPYQKAFDLEKKNRQLSLIYWRVLIDNLAMAYGITGKLDPAEEVLRYGITQDPTYPMFYYVLANVYAERGDMDKTIEHLTTAFKYRANANSGESMPDPKSDDSFQRFMNNERFRKFVESL